MAIDVGRAKPAPAGKYDTFVASQLAGAESRIRLLDLTAALLGFAALALGYVVSMVLCDSKLELSQHARQLSLYAFLAGSAVYLYFTVVRPLRLRVNPYYAARQVEQLLPGAKNSIINWVDLHNQPLPPAIRGALAQRAAKDMAHVDLDRAISGRRAAWMGGVAGLGAIAFVLAFLLLGPSPFLSLLRRAFNPFGQVGVSTRTQLAVLRPEGGNATVTVGRGVGFVVEVTGKIPDPRASDAVKLLYRYQEGDPWLERPLQPEPSREWTTTLSAIEVQNGLWYKVTGGDAATEEYRIRVRAAPALTDFLATYHYRPYVARADEIRRERELKALRGTEVVLRARANRTLREGRLEFEGKDSTKSVRGVPAADDPRTLLVRYVLDEDGRYRLHFTSIDGEAYSDSASYSVQAIPDKPPHVELTKPGQDIRLPADSLLQLEGKAGDDIGVKSLTLRMQVGGRTLQGQPHRSDDKLRLPDGGYPLDVEYKDFIELSGVKSEDGRAFPLSAGMELEYWLEASDACDYLKPNIAESKHYRVRIIEPEKNEKKRQQEKNQARQDQKQHENKQDRKLQKENQDRQEERKNQEARNKEEEKKSKEAGQGGAGENAQQKDKGGKPDEQNPGKQSQGQPDNEGNDPSKEQQDIEKKINEALEKQQQEGEGAKGEAKPDKSNQGEGKGAAQNKPDGANQNGEKSEGEGKGAGQQGKKDAGEGKDKGTPQPGADALKGDGKGDNQPNPKKDDKSETKGGNPMNQIGAGEKGEAKGKPDQPPQPGEGKGGNPQEKKGAGQGKPQPKGQGQDSANGEGKPIDPKGEKAQRERAGEAKDKTGAPTRSEPKGPGDNKDDAKAETKQGGSAPKGKQSARGERKPMPEKRPGEKSGTSEAKPDAGEQARKATPKDVEDLAKDLMSKDAQEREDARRKLEQIQKQAGDPMAREKAGEALDRAGQPDGPAETKPPKQGDGQPGERKDGKGDGSKQAGEPKSKGGDKERGQGEAKGSGENPGQGKKDRSDSSPKGTSKGTSNTEASNTPGGGGNKRNTGANVEGGGDAEPPANQPSKPNAHRAAQMQLEDFLKKVDKKILKDAGVSEEAWRKYVESRRKQLARPQPGRPDTPAGPQQSTRLPSMGGRTISSAPSGQDNSVVAPDRGQPLPAYRDAAREFTRQMTKGK
jgi:hypothetical protein